MFLYFGFSELLHDCIMPTFHIQEGQLILQHSQMLVFVSPCIQTQCVTSDSHKQTQSNLMDFSSPLGANTIV